MLFCCVKSIKFLENKQTCAVVHASILLDIAAYFAISLVIRQVDSYSYVVFSQMLLS